MKRPVFPHLALLGLGMLGAGPLAAQTLAPVLTSNGGTLFVNSGGTLQVNGGYAQTGAALLRTGGTATVAGNLSAAASGLDLAASTLDVTGDVSSGAGAQALGVSGGSVPNLRISKAGGTAALTQPVAVRQVLSVTSAGSLSTNGQPLTLLSNATGTSLIANLGAGLITGNVTVQRYIDGSLNPGLGYRHLTAPVFTATVASFGPGGTTPVVNSAYNSAANPGAVAPFPTVYFYDQARLAASLATTLSAFDKGWQSPDALTDAAPLGGRGFTVQLPGASMLSFTGQVASTSGTTPLSRASGATAAEAGWNLVGNPYPAPLDLSTVAAGQRTNMDAAFYTYESTSQYGGGYRSFVNGFGNPLIGSSQAFFVRVSAGQTSGSLELTNANRVTGLPLQDLVADTNYSNGVNYALLEQQGITPLIPVFGQYKPAVEGFPYNVETDSFTCPAGKPLPFGSYETSLDGGLFKTYPASTRDCRLCPRKPTCAPKTNKRKITRTAYDPHYRRALLRQQSRQGQRMRLVRQSIVEPVFGSLLQHYGLRKVNTRGRASAHKTMLLAAIAYNLKKLLKYRPQRQLGLAVALPKPAGLPPNGLFQRWNGGHHLIK